ncbi:hypothetical protein SAMN04488693_109108 [Arthrobacter subterraneus]|uniref:Uncharacterized protein n=1 Tax=Arthrobacter subterraneus TaxID=335973 RepID=A0A1G8JSD6_9MICC|nr:hypothetical protein [Arthrobacter subterraneus]SDI34003.1 hypothetical protein SAMN04488693_109108 [Arthrobacter subterraneus]
MPTFHDPLADAAEASEALRGLARASRTFDNPADTYAVFGDMTAVVRSLRQVLDQLANAHLTHRDRAHDDHGGHAAGADSALAAADELHQAGTLLDQVHDRLDAAFGHSGRIAWHPGPDLTEEPLSETAARRWVSVVFLQGEDADEVLDLIDREGTGAAIEHLKGFDYGDETTAAALENGYVYDEPPAGPLDHVVADGDYTLTWNAGMGHVSLLRVHLVPPDPSLADATAARSREATNPLPAADRRPPLPQSVRTSPGAEKDWFAGPARATTSVRRGLSL